MTPGGVVELLVIVVALVAWWRLWCWMSPKWPDGRPLTSRELEEIARLEEAWRLPTRLPPHRDVC